MWRISTLLPTLALPVGSIAAETETRQPHVIVHRQALQGAPQNRWAALKQAVLWGVDETVPQGRPARYQGRQDHPVPRPVVRRANDEVLGPTTDWLWEEVNDVDFGSWHDRRFKGERLALFDDAQKGWHV